MQQPAKRDDPPAGSSTVSTQTSRQPVGAQAGAPVLLRHDRGSPRPHPRQWPRALTIFMGRAGSPAGPHPSPQYLPAARAGHRTGVTVRRGWSRGRDRAAGPGGGTSAVWAAPCVMAGERPPAPVPGPGPGRGSGRSRGRGR